MTATFYVGDAITVMNRLPEKSVDLVISSPPFLALRSYLPADHPQKNLEGGSQATPGEYLDWLLDVVDACARVLAPHGSLVFELGDTYSGSGGGGGDYYEGGLREGQPGFTGSEAASRDALKAANAAHWRQKNPLKGKLAEYSDARGNPDGMRDTTFSGGNTRTGGGRGWPLAKSLSLIPESFRWAMVYGHNPFTGRQCDTWRLRNVIRWVRPNPPVGALGDKFRPATSELMVFCKSAKRYFDLDAVREINNPDSMNRLPMRSPKHRENQNPNTGWAKSGPGGGVNNPAGAPPLDWWNIPPGGYPGAHYAVWPPELLIKPVKAMCPEKVCRTCGEPSRRIVNDRTGTNRQPALALHIRERRRVKGFTVDDVNGWFGYATGIQHWESDRADFGRIPNPDDWPILKDRLGLSDEFDVMVNGGNLAEYELGSSTNRHQTFSPGAGFRAHVAQRKTAVSEFTDCGCVCTQCEGQCQIPLGIHDPGPENPHTEPTVEYGPCPTCQGSGGHGWRPGVVLDPFGGSGTTALVATGHGRDCILIDLDERNYDLALDRVGPLVLSRAS